MKAKFLALAALVLALASCQTEPEGFDVVVGGEVETVINVNLPESDTRAASNIGGAEFFNPATHDIRYILEIYQNGTRIKDRDVILSDNGSVAFPVRLVPGRNYTFVVWADFVTNGSKEDLHYNTDTERKGLTNITLNGNWTAMDETRDAYSNVKDVTGYNGTMGIDMELRRPFAKVRVVTTDIAALTAINNLPTAVEIEYTNNVCTTFNALTGAATGEQKYETSYTLSAVQQYTDVTGSQTLYAGYVFANEQASVANFSMSVTLADGETVDNNFNTSIPVQRNMVTTITGDLLTDANNINVEIKPGFDGSFDEEYTPVRVSTAQELQNAISEAVNGEETIIVLGGDIDLSDLLTRAADPTLTVAAGKVIFIDLNGKTLTSTSVATGANYNMFDVRGTLTIKNGTITTKHEGTNMEWNNSTNVFNITAGGVLNLDGVTAKNLGGTDMGFVAHLNNWGEVTLNVNNSTLEANYVPVRVFNSGNDMNNVTITNSTLTGVSAAFWVHNYTVEDFGTEAKAEAQKALLNLNIYNQGNTFSPDLNGIRYGFTNSIRTDAYGITKSVSEDGTEVTLGSIVENGLIRRGVAGAEENNTITKVVVEEGVGVLYDRTFRRFYALETVELPSTLTTIGAAGSGVFQSCTNLKNIVIPESVTVLGKGSFQECSSLESINIPSGVTRIEADALRATGLKSVEFHAGVTYFGAQAFRDCKQLTEVIINAPEFTMEGNTFGITAAPFTPMTIYVANTAMKTYVESKLTAHAKTYITVVAPTEVDTTADINEALANGEDVVLTGDIAVVKSEAGSNGYGATGISQLNGGTIDGNGNDISINAWGTWDSAINTTGGIIKNLNVTGGMRGIFVNHNSTNNSKVILENVTIDGTIYTISCDQGTNNGLEATNSTFNGWTSYAATIGEVKFTNCNFGEGQGYAFCRPYAPTEFVGCEFEAGFTVDPVVAVTFENCTLDGVAITAANIADLVTDTAKVTIK